MRRGSLQAGEAAEPAQVFNLYATEEAVIERADAMLDQLAEVADGVRCLATAYRRGFREQQRLVRMSDRMQSDLHSAKNRLMSQARELGELNAKLSTEIEHRADLEAELRRLLETDALTGALTRRHFIDRAEQEWQHQAETGSVASFLMLDVDRFKQLNDRHGHAAGDRALADFVATCLARLRPGDLMGRVGGEEFAAILPDTSIAVAEEIAEALRSAVADLAVDGPAGPLGISVSIGLVEGCPGETLQAAMSRADKALYEAKRDGRNCVRSVRPDGSLPGERG